MVTLEYPTQKRISCFSTAKLVLVALPTRRVFLGYNYCGAYTYTTVSLSPLSIAASVPYRTHYYDIG